MEKRKNKTEENNPTISCFPCYQETVRVIVHSPFPCSKLHSQIMNLATVYYTGILKPYLESPGNLFCWRKIK